MNATPAAARPRMYRKPSEDLRSKVRAFVEAALMEDFDYREITDLVQIATLEAAQRRWPTKQKAAQKLRISRNHLRDYYNRGKELIS